METPGPILNQEVEVLGQADYSGSCRKITLRIPEDHPVRAGQFCHILTEPGNAPLLRRPFSYWDVRPGEVDLLYTVVGEGTEALAGKRAGERVGYLGPLGIGFTPSDKPVSIFVAGGVGIVPFYLFAKQVRESGKIPRMILLFGGRSKEMLYGIDDFAEVGVEAHAATEDGSRGVKGLVTRLLEKWLPRLDRESIMLYTCGPDPMMNAVVRITRRDGIPGEVCMERRMGCALGACGACVVKVKDGDDWRYSRICFEGPTYDASRLVIE
jgi:dihydroorotate dehydrogenase electron transfer subunit